MRGTQTINSKGHLTIGGVDTVDLAEQFGTPLYVYDTALIKERARQFKAAFSSHKGLKWQVAYASKAFSTIAMIQLMHELDMSLDVVSGGELYTALKAGFPPERIHFHGNNKTKAELELALQAGIGTIIVDNFYELQLLNDLCRDRNQKINILLRITPGVEAHTHEFIMTGHDDTKFGFNLDNGAAEEAVRLALEASHLDLKGVHCHIGSQIFETEGFVRAIQLIYEYARRWSETGRFHLDILNVGGGFGIKYVDADHPLSIDQYVDRIVAAVTGASERMGMAAPEIWVEPGRIIAGEAGTTLYTVGAFKDIPGIRKYIAVDGGMTDNIRPALYQAKYEAMLANKAGEQADEVVAVAGKCCETGDVLIKEARLPACSSGDILAVFCTGAYGYAMASHYNRLPTPAVVFVEQGEATLVVRRETYDDLIRQDVPVHSLSSLH